jgi:type 1 fimbria pilin
MRTFASKLAVLSGLLCVASFAHAQSLNFNLTGVIQPGTCNLQVNGGVNTVDVGTFNSAVFNAIGYETAPISFPLVISNCGPMNKLTLSFTGTADTGTGGTNYWSSGLANAPFYLKNGATVLAPNTGNIVITSGFNQTIELTAGFHGLVTPLTAAAIGTGTAAVTISASYQ